jgi:TIR domain
MTGYWFYLSCAEADWEPYLERFHNDLSRSLSQKTGLPENHVGYFGINQLQTLGEGSQSAIAALNNSRILLQLLTPAYFLSDICAREWQVFRWREQALIGGLAPRVSYRSSIIPIFWDAERTLPPTPAAINSQLESQRREFGDKYANEGLRQLMALSRHLNDYHEFLFTLTDRLYKISTSHELPSIENLPAITDVPGVFSDSGLELPASNPPANETSQPLTQSFLGYAEGILGRSARKPIAREKIFISYRRNDSEGFAGRLFDQLGNHFGEDQIFMDLDTIEPGEDFIEVIQNAVSDCHLMIAIIGKGWLMCADAEGRRRLDNPEDFVRVEISTALEKGIRVIPVLVQGASIPKSNQLPDDLTRLARRNAFELSSTRWKYDVGRLIATIEKVLSR